MLEGSWLGDRDDGCFSELEGMSDIVKKEEMNSGWYPIEFRTTISECQGNFELKMKKELEFKNLDRKWWLILRINNNTNWSRRWKWRIWPEFCKLNVQFQQFESLVQ